MLFSNKLSRTCSMLSPKLWRRCGFSRRSWCESYDLHLPSLNLTGKIWRLSWPWGSEQKNGHHTKYFSPGTCAPFLVHGKATGCQIVNRVNQQHLEWNGYFLWVTYFGCIIRWVDVRSKPAKTCSSRGCFARHLVWGEKNDVPLRETGWICRKDTSREGQMVATTHSSAEKRGEEEEVKKYPLSNSLATTKNKGCSPELTEFSLINWGAGW